MIYIIFMIRTWIKDFTKKKQYKIYDRNGVVNVIYFGTYKSEGIMWHPDNDVDDVHIVSLTQYPHEAVCTVEICCDEDWEWKFDMTTPSNYELVKHMIMDVAFESDNMEEFVAAIDEMFEEDFAAIVVDDERECEGNCCERCGHRGCLN